MSEIFGKIRLYNRTLLTDVIAPIYDNTLFVFEPEVLRGTSVALESAALKKRMSPHR